MNVTGWTRSIEIVVLDHGRIAERGTHRQLRHAGGAYQRTVGDRLLTRAALGMIARHG